MRLLAVFVLLALAGCGGGSVAPVQTATGQREGVGTPTHGPLWWQDGSAPPSAPTVGLDGKLH